MAVTEIDIIQTEKIEALQNDVVEIKDKLNLVVADITSLTTKLNQAIADADDLNDVINAGYSVASGGGASNTGILKRLDELFNTFEAHKMQPTNATTTSNGTYIETHPPDHNFELNPIDPDIKKECDKMWTKEVVDSWINRQQNYSNMSPKERINAGYK